MKRGLIISLFLIVLVFTLSKPTLAANSIPTPDNYDELLQRTVDMINLHGVQVFGFHAERLQINNNRVYRYLRDSLLSRGTNGIDVIYNHWATGQPIGIPDLLGPNGYWGWVSLIYTATGGLAYAAEELTAFYGHPNVPVDQFITQVQLFRKLVMGNYYRQYFSLFEAGYWGSPYTEYAKNEFLWFIQCPSMEEFYAIAGLPTNSMTTVANYENSLANESAVMSSLYLNNMNEVVNVLGAGWYAAASVKRKLFSESSISISMDDALGFVQDNFSFVAGLDGDELQVLEDLEEATVSGDLDVRHLDKLILEEFFAAPGDKGTYDIWANDPPDAILYGTATNNVIYGNQGISNQIIALGGNDIIVPLTGDDIIDGGSGSNYYIWYEGDGNDTITFGGLSQNDTNTLVFGENVNPDGISFEISGEDLLINYTYTTTTIVDDVETETGITETITISDWFVSPGNELSQIRFFGNFAPWSNAEINAMIDEMSAGGFGG